MELSTKIIIGLGITLVAIFMFIMRQLRKEGLVEITPGKYFQKNNDRRS